MKKEMLYCECLRKWGANSQTTMAIEEMSKLIQALSKYQRHIRPANWLTNIHEEIANVQIVLDQLVIGFDGKEAVPRMIEHKLARLQGRLQEGIGDQ